MCLILFAYQVHPVYKLIVAANRDEFYERSTSNAQYWEDCPEILAGRDLEKLGTWMGVTTNGRFSALTNYRNPAESSKGKRSRGELVTNALKYKGNLKDFMQEAAENNDQYPGYNLLAGDVKDLFYYSNVGQRLQRIEPGIYGVSNHLLNTEWPKVKKGKDGLSLIIGGEQKGIADKLMNLLQEESRFQDDLLPNTGVPLKLERMLSPLFIKSDNYGTRSSTVILMSEKEIHYTERAFSGDSISNQQYHIKL